MPLIELVVVAAGAARAGHKTRVAPAATPGEYYARTSWRMNQM
jgi:hypothetical protein